jgi:site-specific recombinase XerD
MGDTSIRKVLDDYKTIYMPYRNFAERTRVEYQNDLTDFKEFLEKFGISDVKKLGLPIIERYVAHLEQRGFASFTRKRKVVTIRSFLSFLYQDGHIQTNISKSVILPFTETTTPHILTQLECDRLRAACSANLRDRAIIELLLQTGIKLSELTRLTINDVDLDQPDTPNEKQLGFIRILGSRSKKERLVPLNDKASGALKSYLEVRGNAENNALFLNRFGEPVSDRGVQKMLRKYLTRAGIGNASIHTLRHTFGAHHTATGSELKTIKEVMGLKDKRSVSVYQTLAKEVVSRELQENSL